MYGDCSDKREGMAAGNAGSEKSQRGGMYASVAMDAAIQLNASGMNVNLDGQGLDNSTASAEKPRSTSGDTSGVQNQTKSGKSRPICLLCKKSFHTQYKLNEHHAIVHLDKRLFSCNVCHKTFGRADHLGRHVKYRVCIQQQQGNYCII